MGLCDALLCEGGFERGPFVLLSRGTADDDGPPFAVVDRTYVSARWFGDAYLFARRVLDLLGPG